MADDSKEDKTEPASARKRADARAKGQVARSQEVNSALVLLASILALTWVGPHTVVRDWGYRFIASRRYKWFGTTLSCRLPSKKERDRLLE